MTREGLAHVTDAAGESCMRKDNVQLGYVHARPPATGIFERFYKQSRIINKYNLNNYKIQVKTQHIISITLYSDMFRLARVIIRLPLNHI